MKTKAIVILFPEREFLGTRTACITLFNKCIEKRYINNDYELVVVRYKGYRNTSTYTGGIINIPSDRIIDADITSNEQLTKFANFEKIANIITEKEYEHIMVGGFHCFDCVEKLAKEIYKSNKNTTIDSDLTDHFDFISRYYKNWDINKFKPELKLEESKTLLKYPDLDLIEKIQSRYSHPIWGITKNHINSLKNKIKESNMEDISLKN